MRGRGVLCRFFSLSSTLLDLPLVCVCFCSVVSFTFFQLVPAWNMNTFIYPQKVFWRTSHGHVVTAGFFPFAIILPGLPRVGRAQHAFPLPNDRILSTRAFARTYDMYQQYILATTDKEKIIL